jgi:hypothetical protein
LDRKAKKLLTTHKQHHQNAAIDCLYVPRKQGGKRLIQLDEAYIVEVVKLMEYVYRQKDPLMQTVNIPTENKLSNVTDSYMWPDQKVSDQKPGKTN